jgi:pilus assembly protein Flp/PilA
MKDALLKLYAKLQILRDDCGQDLVEYALVVALIALAAVTGMQGLATSINGAFTKVGSNLGTYVT